MCPKKKRISRILKGKNGKEIEADKMLMGKYNLVFGSDYIERVEVIDIQTVYNDYKKLYDDLYDLARTWGKKILCFSCSSDILEFVKMKDIRKACKKKRLTGQNSKFSVSKVCACFLTLINIANVMLLFIPGEIYPLSKEIVLSILSICLLLTIISIAQQSQKYDSELLEKLNDLDEDGLIDLYSCLEQKKNPLSDEGIFFVENFNKLNKHCRSYIIAYLRHKEYKKQIWCVFDYLFEKSLKIDSVAKMVFYESFKLKPLKYEDKEAIYKEYNLQRDISKEYLNCIGVDILWGSKTDVDNSGIKDHSLDYIRERIESVRKEFDSNGRLTRVFYCLVYMSSKYKYSFSMDQIISLVQNDEKVNGNLRVLISDAASKVLGGEAKSKEEIRDFISKIVNLLCEYCFIAYEKRGGKEAKKYKFSYDILECFQEKMSGIYPDEETVKRWILVKLICNKEIFWMERYFFDCSNLLLMSDFLEDYEFCILSSYLLRTMNANNCWVYSSFILKRLRFINENIRNQYLQTEAVKRASENCLFYISDAESTQWATFFLANKKGFVIDLDNLSFDRFVIWMPEIEKYSSVLSGYFKLLYKTFGSVVLSSFRFGNIYQDIDIEAFTEQEKLLEIIRRMLMCCIYRLKGHSFQKDIKENIDWISRQLPRITMCAEANEFASIVKEMLLWIKSELEGKRNNAYTNIYIGMLIETSNSNMLYFIYSLLKIALAKEVPDENKNPLLNFIIQSVFYINVLAQAEGIAQYVDTLLHGRQSIDLRLNIAIELLIKENPCKEILSKFIIDNMDRAESLFLSRLEYQNTEQIENYIALLLLYNDNLNSVEFTKKIFGQIFNYLSSSECTDGDIICKYLLLILENKSSEEDVMNIVDEINKIASRDFAVWVLHGYYKIKREMLERIPQINHEILTECSSNLSNKMISEYLLSHNYYDCNLEVLELYLNTMRNNKFPCERDIIYYLDIIDKYAIDNINIKYNQIGTYNYMLSLHFFYMAVNLSEQKKSDGILLRETLNFMLKLISSLQMVGMKIVEGEQSFTLLVKENNALTRKEAADKLIIEKFLYMTPVVIIEGEKCLSEDYYYMILYMYTFQDVCISLIRRAEEDCIEIIKQKHMLYLVNVLIDCTQINTLGFNRQSLYRVRNILGERYNIRY